MVPNLNVVNIIIMPFLLKVRNYSIKKNKYLINIAQTWIEIKVLDGKINLGKIILF